MVYHYVYYKYLNYFNRHLEQIYFYFIFQIKHNLFSYFKPFKILLLIIFINTQILISFSFHNFFLIIFKKKYIKNKLKIYKIDQ